MNGSPSVKAALFKRQSGSESPCRWFCWVGIYRANAKAKANATQGLPELIEIAAGKRHTENYKEKHMEDAMYGWYRYESRFALPVFNGVGEIERYNVFNVIMVIRHAKDGKMYLYDIMNIKKETSTLFQSEDITQ